MISSPMIKEKQNMREYMNKLKTVLEFFKISSSITVFSNMMYPSTNTTNKFLKANDSLCFELAS